MQILECIKERKVAQGDLVFIYHKTKPQKTGWWRKMREGCAINKKIYYILEKPMHNGFDIKKEYPTSHIESGFCVMTDTTLKNGIEQGKYEVLADIRSVNSVFLSTNGYKLSDVFLGSALSIPEDKENVFITERFKKLYELYKRERKQVTDLESLVCNII